MIVPMKKVSLLVLDSERKRAMKALRALGLVHIEISEGQGSRLSRLKGYLASLEECVMTLSDRADKNAQPTTLTRNEAVAIANETVVLTEEKLRLRAETAAIRAELDRLADLGEINPAELAALKANGVSLSLYEMSPSEYAKLDESITTVLFKRTRSMVRFLHVRFDADSAETATPPSGCLVELPTRSTEDMRQSILANEERIKAIDAALDHHARSLSAIKTVILALHKEIEFETLATGMQNESLSDGEEDGISVAYLVGYIPSEELPKLSALAKENAWGMIAEDPTPEDDVPTKLHNNRFVSLVYPLTDFIGTVPGYFEYDISGWFLAFILVFFGIIFGDGGYGLLICAAAGAMILKSVIAKKPIADAWILIALLGAATILWGTLTCTWFGLTPDQIPVWLQKLSIPVISNVYGDKIWYPFWTNGEAGLTTAQNVQIFCFSLALIQLSVAHVKGMLRNRGSLKLLGDLGSIFQLIGIFYVVLSLVVNGAVFGLGLVVNGVPIGTLAIVFVGIGFAMSFIFANYEGKLGASILESLKNIVSVLLGVVNVFSDIVSYIRLWAVGLAGAAISATVNELAGPLFGNFVFMIFAIILLVFGHGLNMILNVLSVIVHGVRLNTLEFSSHLDMSWSGHKYKPFEE